MWTLGRGLESTESRFEKTKTSRGTVERLFDMLSRVLVSN